MPLHCDNFCLVFRAFSLARRDTLEEVGTTCTGLQCTSTGNPQLEITWGLTKVTALPFSRIDTNTFKCIYNYLLPSIPSYNIILYLLTTCTLCMNDDKFDPGSFLLHVVLTLPQSLG